MSQISNKVALYSLLIAQNNKILIFKEVEAYLNFETSKIQLCDGISIVIVNCYEAVFNAFNDSDIDETIEEIKKYQRDCKDANLLHHTFAQWIEFISPKLIDDVNNIQKLNENEFRKDLSEKMIFFKECFFDLES